MNLKQMFPKETLDGEDLHAWCRDNNNGLPITVTIERVEYKTNEADGIGEAEITYYMFVREFRKAFKLTKTRAEIIAAVLKTPETDEWFGRTVKIKGDTVVVQGTIWWVIQPVIDPPDATSRLPQKQDITNYAFQPRPSLGTGANAPRTTGSPVAAANPNEKLGEERALVVANALNRKARSFADAVAHLVKYAPQIGAVAEGCFPPDWPLAAGAWINQMLKDLPKVQADLTDDAKKALVESWRVEVTNGAPAGAKPAGAPISEDDIPF